MRFKRGMFCATRNRIVACCIAGILGGATSQSEPYETDNTNYMSGVLSKLKSQLIHAGLAGNGHQWLEVDESGFISLDLSSTDVDNLMPIQGLPIRELNLWRTAITNLEPLRGMPLQRLNLRECIQLRDICPLFEMVALRELVLPRSVDNVNELRHLRNLERVSYSTKGRGRNWQPAQTVKEFWGEGLSPAKSAIASNSTILSETIPNAEIQYYRAAETEAILNNEGAYIGVEGIIRSVSQSAGRKMTYMEMYGSAPGVGLHFTIFPRDRARIVTAFGGDLTQSLEMTRVIIRGKVTRFRNRPSIVLSWPNQIEVVNGKNDSDYPILDARDTTRLMENIDTGIVKVEGLVTDITRSPSSGIWLVEMAGTSRLTGLLISIHPQRYQELSREWNQPLAEVLIGRRVRIGGIPQLFEGRQPTMWLVRNWQIELLNEDSP